MNIRNITFIENPRLFNEVTGQQGEGFKMPSTSENFDVIVPLHPDVVDHFPDNPSAILLNLPSHIRRVWIYETHPVSAVTMVLRLNENNTPCRLYQLHSPLTSIKIRGKYGCLPPVRSRYAPSWIVRDYGTHLSLIRKYNVDPNNASRSRTATKIGSDIHRLLLSWLTKSESSIRVDTNLTRR